MSGRSKEQGQGPVPIVPCCQAEGETESWRGPETHPGCVGRSQQWMFFTGHLLGAVPKC